MIDILGHIAYIFLFIGTLLLNEKMLSGWIFRIIGSALWLALGVKMGYSSIWFWSGVFLIGDTRGWFRWKRKS